MIANQIRHSCDEVLNDLYKLVIYGWDEKEIIALVIVVEVVEIRKLMIVELFSFLSKENYSIILVETEKENN